MAFVRKQAITGFTFGLVNKSTGAALTGVASAIGKYITKDGGTQASLSGTIAEEGNGQYSINTISATEMDAAIVGLLFTHADAVPVQFTIKTVGSPADTSTESDLSLSYNDIRKEIGWFLFGERNSSNWSSDESSQIDDIIKSGLRTFYHPAPTQQAPNGHKWSFLEPTTTLSLADGTEDYTLSADFGGMIGTITYSSGDNRWYPIEITGEHRIRQLRQRFTESLSGQPKLAAIRPISTDGSNGQRFQLMVYPKPDSNYTVSYRYHALPGKIDGTYPYPKGGAAHAETILEACLAIAESRMDNAAGIHAAAFQNRLNASIAFDKKMHSPEFLGYNGQPEGVYTEQDHRYHNGQIVTYNGSYFNPS